MGSDEIAGLLHGLEVLEYAIEGPPTVAAVITPAHWVMLRSRAVAQRPDVPVELPPALGAVAGTFARIPVVVIGCVGKHVEVPVGLLEPRRCRECGAVMRQGEWRAA